MKITSSYGIEIKQMNKIFRPTVVIYNEAISFCIEAFENEWLAIEQLDTMQRKQYAESLIHTTKNNKAKYDFDIKFYKIPSYIRVSHICAWNTSKLAYDGSGTVIRNTSNYSLATFSNGKKYNCDLSASYNIGARYCIRELEKSTSVKKWSLIQAKVPECVKRTQCTYNTLIEILNVA